ncbi:MAG: hypothetical protein ACK4IC_11365 [Erythrobacter sp.]
MSNLAGAGSSTALTSGGGGLRADLTSTLDFDLEPSVPLNEAR